MFHVVDGGPGLDGAQVDRLFRRFGRLDRPPTRTLGSSDVGQPSGTGLGLHLCQLFVRRMHGQIWAANNPHGPGATFSFCLPLSLLASPGQERRRRLSITQTKLSTAPHCDEQSAVALKNRDADVGGGSKDRVAMKSKTEHVSVYERRILVVDDTLINRKILARMLRQIGFDALTTVESGTAALAELRQRHYDLVLADLQMPGMSGLDLSAVLRDARNGDRAGPVVVGLTADTSLDVVERCKLSGMSDVIHKPITVEELRDFFENRISVLLRE